MEVSATTPVLQTDNASLGATIEGRAVTEMPLNGRNVYALVGLVPGAVPQNGTSQSPSGQNVFGAGNFAIGGGGANEASSTLDGAPLNTNYLHITALVPTQDSIAEFKVQTNNVESRVRQLPRRRHEHGFQERRRRLSRYRIRIHSQ